MVRHYRILVQPANAGAGLVKAKCVSNATAMTHRVVREIKDQMMRLAQYSVLISAPHTIPRMAVQYRH
jgi:hypothetical protein